MFNFKDREFTLNFIQEHNHRLKKSLREIEREFSLANGTMSRWCRVHSIDTLSKADMASIIGKRNSELGLTTGANHWAYGMTKENSDIFKRHSERMKANNPVHNAFTRAKIINSMAENFRKNIASSEIKVLEFLTNNGFDFVHQYVFGNRIVDFAIPSAKIFIECDGRGHSDPERRAKELVIDKIANEDGWIVFRIDDIRSYRNCNIENVFSIITKFIPNFNLVSFSPSNGRNKKRVLIRHPNSDSEIICNDPNDPIIASLIHGV